MTWQRGTESLRCPGFQPSLGRKEGAAVLYPFKARRWGQQDLEPRVADAREARD